MARINARPAIAEVYGAPPTTVGLPRISSTKRTRTYRSLDMLALSGVSPL
jgi:hypothetical protein